MDLRWPLRIEEDRCDGVIVLTVTGRLGAASAVPFGAGLAEVLSRGNARVVIDLQGVDYISSAGLAALAAAASLCVRSQGTLVLCGLTDPVRIALDLGGLLAEFPVEPSREQAVARVAAPSWSSPADEG
jgi:anti-sigma B factor antagonist